MHLIRCGCDTWHLRTTSGLGICTTQLIHEIGDVGIDFSPLGSGCQAP
jgi:hypothetical protein